jgi:hypothetical protein
VLLPPEPFPPLPELLPPLPELLPPLPLPPLPELLPPEPLSLLEGVQAAAWVMRKPAATSAMGREDRIERSIRVLLSGKGKAGGTAPRGREGSFGRPESTDFSCCRETSF